jgi:hypothetical protein
MKMPSHPVAGAIGMGAIFFAMSAYWINDAEWSIRIDGVVLPGIAICTVGFMIGLLCYKPNEYEDVEKSLPTKPAGE